MTLADWVKQWTAKSPAVQARVKIALDFLTAQYGKSTAAQERVLSEIKCTDFSHPVELPMIPAGTKLVGSKDPRTSPYRATYFTKSGHPANRLGISTDGQLRTNPRVLPKALYVYEVVVTIPRGEALQSICAPAADTWSMAGKKVLADGGGLQYLIPKMNRYLRHVP